MVLQAASGFWVFGFRASGLGVDVGGLKVAIVPGSIDIIQHPRALGNHSGSYSI